MPPFLPLMSLNRSQNVRLGRGPGNNVPPAFTGGTSNVPRYAFYADLGDPEVRRDYQRHSAIGSLADIGATSNTVWSDFYKGFGGTGLVVTAGSTYFWNVSPQQVSLNAPNITSRTYGNTTTVSQVDGTAFGSGASSVSSKPAAATGLDRWDLIYVDGRTGRLAVQTGPTTTVAAVQQVTTITPVGVPAAGTAIKIGFTWNGFNYTTTSFAYNVSNANLATAFAGATGGPKIPTASVVASSGPLPLATTITFAKWMGPVTNISVVDYGSDFTASTGFTFATTTLGSGAQSPRYGGSNFPLASAFVPGAAANTAAYVPLTAYTLPTS